MTILGLPVNRPHRCPQTPVPLSRLRWLAVGANQSKVSGRVVGQVIGSWLVHRATGG